MKKGGIGECDRGVAEKKSKPKSEKGKKTEESANIGTMKAIIEHIQVSENEDIAKMKRGLEREKENKNKGTKDYKADIKKGAKKVELTVAYGDDGSGHARDKAERKMRKREKKKNKNDRFETGNTQEVEGSESEKWPEGESISGTKISVEVKKERKEKCKRNHKDGDFKKGGEKDGEEVGSHSQSFNIHVMEMVERKKRKKENSKSSDGNRWQVTFSEAKHDGGDLSSLASLQQESMPDNAEGNFHSIKCDGNAANKLKRKKKHKKKENLKDDSSAAQHDSVFKDDNGPLHTDSTQISEVECANKSNKRKTKLVENGSNDAQDNEIKGKKKVRFSCEVEVFPVPGDSYTRKWNDKEENLVRGKRFTLEEDEIVKEAVCKYIHEHLLGDEGLHMVLNSKKYPEVKGCWKEIGSAIPYRPYSAVYFRAHVLFRRSENRKWTREEYDTILKYHEKHGSSGWRVLADELGKHERQVTNAWSRIRLRNLKKGHWSQKEYQKLFDLVNADLQLKVSQEKISKHGFLRDNISWTVISDELSTRNQAACCLKWYRQLTSSMVAEGVWADADDYRLIGSLYSLDATCVEDVDWDDLVEGRSADVCRKRWNQMALHIGDHGHKSFAEQVEVLAQRYSPDLLEARETWDSKPRIP